MVCCRNPRSLGRGLCTGDDHLGQSAMTSFFLPLVNADEKEIWNKQQRHENLEIQLKLSYVAGIWNNGLNAMIAPNGVGYRSTLFYLQNGRVQTTCGILKGGLQ